MISNCVLYPGRQLFQRVKIYVGFGGKHVKEYSQLIRPTQYDGNNKLSPRFKLTQVLKTNWEILPLFVTTAAAMTIVVTAICWACWNKVDVSWNHRNDDTISRTMDLRNPSVHKMRIINQRYEPWPEMQDLLDKMRAAEKRIMSKAKSCALDL